MTEYQIVILRVPFDRPQHIPSKWDWTALTDSTAPVVVLDCDPVSDDPDVQPIERLPEPQAGDPCPHPDCDLHLVWDPQERIPYCTADWEHG